MLDGEELARAAEAGLDLVDDQQHAVPVAEFSELAHEVQRRRNEATLTKDRLDDDRRDTLRRDLRLEEVLKVGHRRLGGPSPIRVWEWRLVDLCRVGSEVLLVRLDAAGEAEGEERAAVKAAAEADHRRPPGRRAGDLDRVLDRLGAGAEEDGLLRAVDRRDLAKALGESQVGLVVHDLERGVGRAVELLPHRLHDARVGVSHVHHSDSAREVDVALAADVPDLRSLGAVHGHRMGAGDTPGDVLGAKVGQLGFRRFVPHRHAAIQADTIRDL